MSSVCLSEAGLCHGSAVAWGGRGVLILGPSGAGKSTLALQMIAMGADLVADDQVIVTAQDPDVMLHAPKTISAQIEARGVGILRAPAVAAALHMVVDLDASEPERLPPWREIDVAGRSFPLILGAGRPHLASAVMVYLRNGRVQ